MTKGTALVTGATGFIASRLVPALLDEGWAVRACGRRDRPAEFPTSVDYRAVDLVESEQLGPMFDGVTDLFHLAGASSSTSSDDEMHQANVVATERLLEAAPRDHLERVVHMSSTSVYGEEAQLPLPVREDVEPHPSRGYGKAKWETEQVVWEQGRAGMPVVVVRPASVYGPGNIKLLASAVLDVAIEAFAAVPAIAVPAEPVEQRLVHIDGLVRACVHLARDEAAVGRAFNVVAEAYPSSHEIARILAEQFGMDVELSDDTDCGLAFEERKTVHDTMVGDGMEPRILLTEERFRFMRKTNRNNRVSVDALLDTGFRFAETDLEASIGRTVAWYRDHRWVI
ncbi:NAD-dependent epimerase/dehydratase family protein [soil metagenome]